MTRHWQLIATTFGPGILSGLIVVARSVFRTFVLDQCDMKLGCSGGVDVMAAVAAVSLLLSALGLAVASFFNRRVLGRLPAKWVAYLVVLVAAPLTVMLFWVGHWPLEPIALGLLGWSVASALIGWAALAFVRHLAPNNSFKPTPLRGAA